MNIGSDPIAYQIRLKNRGRRNLGGGPGFLGGPARPPGPPGPPVIRPGGGESPVLGPPTFQGPPVHQDGPGFLGPPTLHDPRDPRLQLRRKPFPPTA